MTRWTVHHGDAVECMRKIPDASVDAVISDPPYPEIDRPYGRMTESDWHALMREVVEQSRRILKPSGSAVFILQPNSERVGRMRPWLWEFMAWTAREWNQVQDAWWWNFNAMPEANAIQGGLMRGSAKAMVWLGPSHCYRDQAQILWGESDGNRALRLAGRVGDNKQPSGHHKNKATIHAAAAVRGGVTPYNVLPMANNSANGQAGAEGHGAGTPLPLAAWWTRYICPPGGVVCDPFTGSGTMGIAALESDRTFVGVERDAGYVEIARRRLAAVVTRGIQVSFGSVT